MSRSRVLLLACTLAVPAYAPYEAPAVQKRLVLNVNFETAKDYDITSAYAVRGWNTTEGHMRITCPSPAAKHGGKFGMAILIDRAFTKSFHAQFSLPHFMTRLQYSGYQLTFWAKLTRASAREITAEIVFLDVDEGYEWIGGAEVDLSADWQHFAMEPVYTTPAQRGHEIQIAFLIGLKVAEFAFDDIELYELDVLSPPPPSPPPPPHYLLWLDGEGGPKGVQSITAAGISKGKLSSDLSSKEAAHSGMYGFEVSVAETFEKNWHGLLSLPAFLVTNRKRLHAHIHARTPTCMQPSWCAAARDSSRSHMHTCTYAHICTYR